HGYEDTAARAIRSHGLLERTIVSSFNADSLRRLATLEPSLARGYTYPYDRYRVSDRPRLAPIAGAVLLGLRRTLPMRIAQLLGRAKATAAMLHHSVVSRGTVERAHRHGAAVFTWTVDDRAVLGRVLDAGVDAVITNDPRILADYTQGS